MRSTCSRNARNLSNPPSEHQCPIVQWFGFRGSVPHIAPSTVACDTIVGAKYSGSHTQQISVILITLSPHMSSGDEQNHRPPIRWQRLFSMIGIRSHLVNWREGDLFAMRRWRMSTRKLWYSHSCSIHQREQEAQSHSFHPSLCSFREHETLQCFRSNSARIRGRPDKLSETGRNFVTEEGRNAMQLRQASENDHGIDGESGGCGCSPRKQRLMRSISEPLITRLMGGILKTFMTQMERA
jgi:hypothetical protein